MCFSDTASVTADALLTGVGTLTLRSASRPRELPFAAIPLLFAIQSVGEGVIWLTFRYGDGPARRIRLSAFLCGGNDDALPDVDCDEHTS